MTVYTANIPQSGDNPSFSQDQILQNFQTLNTAYGTDGDHYAWTNTNSTEATFHAKVTMPGLPTASVPGNALPTPAAGQDAIFSQTRNSQTTPFLVRDGLVPTAPLTNIWPLMPIKAYASITLIGSAGAATINDSFNITSATVTGGGTPFVTFIMTNPTRTSVYGVLLSFTGALNTLYYTLDSNTEFYVSGFGLSSVQNITVCVIES